jgi:hypothetical protein
MPMVAGHWRHAPPCNAGLPAGVISPQSTCQLPCVFPPFLAHKLIPLTRSLPRFFALTLALCCSCSGSDPDRFARSYCDSLLLSRSHSYVLADLFADPYWRESAREWGDGTEPNKQCTRCRARTGQIEIWGHDSDLQSGIQPGKTYRWVEFCGECGFLKRNRRVG